MTNVLKIKLIVLGAKGVGKSAVVVRFLTKRYIGEYQSNIDILYKKEYRSDDVCANLEILDISTNQEMSASDLDGHIGWANGFVVLYDISDRQTFNEAKQSLEAICSLRDAIKVPLLVLANKKDMEAGREVPISDGRSLAVRYGGQFYEVSAADSFVGVSVSFDAIIREIYSQRISRSPQLSSNTNYNIHKKLSIITVSRVIGAVFGRHNSVDELYNLDMHLLGGGNYEVKSKRSAHFLGSRGFNKTKKSKSATMIRVTRKQSHPILSV